MFLLKQILPAAIISVVVAAGVCGFAFFWKKERLQVVLAPLATGAAYFAGHLFITGWVAFPPKDTTNWLPYFAVTTAMLSAIFRALHIKAWLGLVFLFLLSALALRLLFRPKFEYGWLALEGYIWVGLLAIAVVLVAFILEAVASFSTRPIETPALLLLLCAGSFASLILSGSMLLAQLAVVLGAAVLGTFILNFTGQKFHWDRGILMVFAVLLSMLLLSGCTYAELPPSCVVLIAFAPVVGLLPTGYLPLPAFPVRAALVSAPILIALFLAFRSSPPLNY